VDGITIIKSDYTKKYDTIEELLIAENLDILYPAALPEGVKIERVKIFVFDDGRENILFMFNTDICAIQITNYYSIDLETIQNYSIYSTDKTGFYITKSHDDSYQAIAQLNNIEYKINSLNYNDLIYILSNMKGLSK
jgi:hypothetical protein